MQMGCVRNFFLNEVGSIFEAYVRRASSATWFELAVSSAVEFWPLRNTLHAEGVLGTFIFPEQFFMTTSLLSARHRPGWTAKEAKQLLFRDLG